MTPRETQAEHDAQVERVARQAQESGDLHPGARTTKAATPKVRSKPIEVTSRETKVSGLLPTQRKAKPANPTVVISDAKSQLASTQQDVSDDSWVKASGLKATAIDTLMERASQALIACDYFRTQELCTRALDKAIASSDFERCARAIMPLQEARRQLRQMATDEAELTKPATHPVHVHRTLPSTSEVIAGGFHLLEPPLVGIDAANFRFAAQRARASIMVLVKEPTTKSGLWPIVGVGTGEPFPAVVRVLVEPPNGFAGVKSMLDVDPSAVTRTDLIAWMLATQERLGDAAIAKVKGEWSADHRVLDFAELFAAVPDHEKLAQAFAATCLEAAKAPRNTHPRRRGVAENKYSF